MKKFGPLGTMLSIETYDKSHALENNEDVLKRSRNKAFFICNEVELQIYKIKINVCYNDKLETKSLVSDVC